MDKEGGVEEFIRDSKELCKKEGSFEVSVTQDDEALLCSSDRHLFQVVVASVQCCGIAAAVLIRARGC